MKPSDVKESVVKRRGSILRTTLIIISLVPTWHLMGRDLFHLSASDSSSSSTLEKFKVLPYPSESIGFVATAYCENGITKSGVPVAEGIVAADPRFLPLGTWIEVKSPMYSGIYQVMDTGRLVKGKKIDIYIPSYVKAIQFGVRKIKVTVLRYGAIRMKPVPLAL